MRPYPVITLAISVTALLALMPASLAETWREQVEADWLLQDSRRSQAAPEPVSREDDAAGAVDGIKDGKWGFHTWQPSMMSEAGRERVGFRG
jgi:hypothetical protein